MVLDSLLLIDPSQAFFGSKSISKVKAEALSPILQALV